MALDLFVNYERYSNSSIFYRTVSPSPVTFNVKLSDLSDFDHVFSELYVEWSINNDGKFNSFPLTEDGYFMTDLTWNTSTPCVCSITVSISAAGTLEQIQTVSMSGVFVESLPVVDFLAWPKFYISNYYDKVKKAWLTSYKENSATMVDDGRSVSKLPWHERLEHPGLFFYGEGHTETIYLSSNPIPNVNYYWYIGNNIDSIRNGNTSDVLLTSTRTTTVRITSAPLQEVVYPISIWATSKSQEELYNEPIITYRDDTGEPEYYPYFFSSIVLSGGELPSDYKLRGSIKVFPYPTDLPSVLIPPFPPVFNLPVDYSTQTFTATVSTTPLSARLFMSEHFIGTRWELEASSEMGEWSILTPFLSTVVSYQFPLAYNSQDTGYSLPLFRTVPVIPTTVTLNVSSFKYLYVNLPPYDWAPREVCTVEKTKTIVNTLPFAKLYTPNYYNLKNQDVTFTVVDNNVTQAPFLIKSLTIKSKHSAETLVLSGGVVSGTSGTLKFNKVGSANLYTSLELLNTINGNLQTINAIFPRMIEIVSSYENNSDPDYFQSSVTPLKFTYGDSVPVLSPNEWAIADNVNSIIEKIYTAIDDIDDYTKLYERKDVLYGWIGPRSLYRDRTENTTGEFIAPKLVWMDLECSGYEEPEDEYLLTWGNYECTNWETLSSQWMYHECTAAQSDPSCYGRHCLEWSWRARAFGLSNVSVTWASTKCDGLYNKKWKVEKCGGDADPINCDRGNWFISNIDPFSFPLPYSDSMSRCAIIKAEACNKTNQIVLAYQTEINLINKDYKAKYVARRGTADSTFAFQNISGITISPDGKIFVLDKDLPKVSVFNIENDSFVPVSVWGNFGLVDNPTGFNQPLDIHVDVDNFIWIADTGNSCIKKYTTVGKPLQTITHEKFANHAPLSIVVDSQGYLHCLTNVNVMVFDSDGNFSFEYGFPSETYGYSKIGLSHNKEMIYVSHVRGVLKYFRTGVICDYLIQDLLAENGGRFQYFNSITQDMYRNIYVTVGDKVLKIADLQHLSESKAPLPQDLYWKLDELKVHKEEYIQPWVYLKSFHRLWDNIELLRNSLFYKSSGCKSYNPPVYAKTDLIIGQNEIVTSSVINRLSEQLWTNIKSLAKYFDLDCKN